MSTVTAEQNNGKLSFEHRDNYESRGISTEKMIRDAVEKYNIDKNFKFTVWTGDGCNKEYFSVCVYDDCYDRGFPCFIFDSYKEVGMQDYSSTISSFNDSTPLTAKIGWIGAIVNPIRKLYLDRYRDTVFSEGILNDWNRVDRYNLSKNTPTYLTYQDQIDRWKYLLDIEGAGYSGRTKVFLNSPRIVFIVERRHKEWWYEHIKPWIHYIPVKSDLSDLEENYNRIESDPLLQKFIKHEQIKFTRQHLTYDSALNRIKDIIESI